MKAYIQVDKNNDYYNVNAFIASVGFKSLGFEVIKYFDANDILDFDKEAIFVGGIGMIRKRLAYLGLPKKYEDEYPNELQAFLKRKVWVSSLNKVIEEQQTGIFIKPLQTKLFQGKVINKPKDFLGLFYEQDIKIWCSQLIDIVTEWRCFIRYKTILDVRYYNGRWDSQLDLSIVNQAIKAFKSQPAAYCLDFGVDKHGEYYLIEVNDGHSLGAYGMGAISYAKLLSARWAELTNTRDYLNF